MILRPGTSDRAVYRQVFEEAIYDTGPSNPSLILDLGAYTGISTRWFLDRYPGATVVAVEPDPANAALLKANAPEAEIRAVAVGGSAGRTVVFHPEGGAWRATTVPEIGGAFAAEVDVETVDSILGGRRADIVKMDIEGAEMEVFEADCEWLAGVRLLFVEQHDRFRPGCVHAIRHALDATRRPYRWVPNGGANACIRFLDS